MNRARAVDACIARPLSVRMSRLTRQTQGGETMSWQVQEAKQRFSFLVQQAIDCGPQVVTRRGQDVVVILSIEEYHRLIQQPMDFKTFLMTGPSFDDLDLERDRDLPREIDL